MNTDNPLALQHLGIRRNEEKKFEGLVKSALTALGCEVEKLHGSEFQTGLPDLLVLTPPRITQTGKRVAGLRLIELKWSRHAVATVGELFGLLRGRQKSLLPLWGRKGAPIWIACGTCFVAHPNERNIDVFVTHTRERDWNQHIGPLSIKMAMEAIIRCPSQR